MACFCSSSSLISFCLARMYDALEVLGGELAVLLAEVLAQRLVPARRIDELHLALAVLRLAVGEHPDVGRDAGVVEHVERQGDDSLQPVVCEHLVPERTAGRPTRQAPCPGHGVQARPRAPANPCAPPRARRALPGRRASARRASSSSARRARSSSPPWPPARIRQPRKVAATRAGSPEGSPPRRARMPRVRAAPAITSSESRARGAGRTRRLRARTAFERLRPEWRCKGATDRRDSLRPTRCDWTAARAAFTSSSRRRRARQRPASSTPRSGARRGRPRTWPPRP